MDYFVIYYCVLLSSTDERISHTVNIFHNFLKWFKVSLALTSIL
jgi:hypothetical protein